MLEIILPAQLLGGLDYGYSTRDIIHQHANMKRNQLAAASPWNYCLVIASSQVDNTSCHSYQDSKKELLLLVNWGETYNIEYWYMYIFRIISSL